MNEQFTALPVMHWGGNWILQFHFLKFQLPIQDSKLASWVMPNDILASKYVRSEFSFSVFVTLWVSWIVVQKNIRVRVRVIAVSCHVIKNTRVRNTVMEYPEGTLIYASNFMLCMWAWSTVRRMENTTGSHIANPLYWPCLLMGNHDFILRLLKCNAT